MPEFDPKAIRDTLRQRDVALNPPVTIDALDRLTRWAGSALHPDVTAILHEFDGFAKDDFDAPSFVSVWPVSKAMESCFTKRPILAFSDHAFDAIIFGFDPLVAGPIIAVGSKWKVASTYRDFWSLLLSEQLI